MLQENQALSANKKTCPCNGELLGQETYSCGATRLGASLHPLTHTSDMLTFDHGESCSVFHTGIHDPFLVALRSPFSPAFPAAIPPSAALWEESGMTYSLFFNGLIVYIYTRFLILCQPFCAFCFLHVYSALKMRPSSIRKTSSGSVSASA